MGVGKELRMGRLFNAEVVRKVVQGGADAVLLTPGIARLAYKELVGTGTSLMLRMDGTATSIGPDLTNDELICSVEAALRMGADAVATFGVIGVPREAQLSRKIGTTADECDRWGMPMMTEIIPSEVLSHQFKDRAKRKWPSDPEVIKFSARVAAELGAEDDPEVFLRFVREAIKCGASGVSVGRNVWTYKDPAAMTRALCRIVHEEASVEEAMKEL